MHTKTSWSCKLSREPWTTNLFSLSSHQPTKGIPRFKPVPYDSTYYIWKIIIKEWNMKRVACLPDSAFSKFQNFIMCSYERWGERWKDGFSYSPMIDISGSSAQRPSPLTSLSLSCYLQKHHLYVCVCRN